MAGEPKPTDLAVGEVLRDTFRLDQQIGEGGMGRVFSATDLKLDRKVAVKVLRASNLDDETVRRFDRETQVMGQLDHPGVVTLFSSGRTRAVPWLAMRLLFGHDLWQTLDRAGGRISPAALLPIARQILHALGYLHGRKLVHRDLKPSNIHVGTNGKVTLCDFGLARGHQSRLTRTGVVWGTPDYMSPEQIVGETALDGRTDLYSLSVVLFRMLAGAPLFPETDDHDLLRAHLEHPRPDLSRVVPGARPELGAALQKGLAIRPEDRFQSAEEMLQVLEGVLAPEKAAAKTKRLAPLEDDDAAEATRPLGFDALGTETLDSDAGEPTHRDGFAPFSPAPPLLEPDTASVSPDPEPSPVAAKPEPASPVPLLIVGALCLFLAGLVAAIWLL